MNYSMKYSTIENSNSEWKELHAMATWGSSLLCVTDSAFKNQFIESQE